MAPASARAVASPVRQTDSRSRVATPGRQASSPNLVKFGPRKGQLRMKPGRKTELQPMVPLASEAAALQFFLPRGEASVAATETSSPIQVLPRPVPLLPRQNRGYSRPSISASSSIWSIVGGIAKIRLPKWHWAMICIIIASTPFSLKCPRQQELQLPQY